jgi:hypothetical protein
MLRTVMISTALSGALVGAAFAQSSTPSTPATTPSPAPSAASSTPSSGTSGSAQFINSQKPDQYLASKFRGTDVLGPENEKIGDVTDLVFDKNGKVEAYVVSVGGFLGIGAKDVALAPSAFQVVPADQNSSYDRLRLSMTKDQLKQAANFEPYNPPRTTTGAAGGMGSPAGTTPRSPASTNTPPSTKP